MIQMLLMDIGQDSNVRGDGHIFQLVAGQLADNDCLRPYILHQIEYRNTYISRQNGIIACVL